MRSGTDLIKCGCFSLSSYFFVSRRQSGSFGVFSSFYDNGRTQECSWVDSEVHLVSCINATDTHITLTHICLLKIRPGKKRQMRRKKETKHKKKWFPLWHFNSGSQKVSNMMETPDLIGRMLGHIGLKCFVTFIGIRTYTYVYDIKCRNMSRCYDNLVPNSDQLIIPWLKIQNVY